MKSTWRILNIQLIKTNKSQNKITSNNKNGRKLVHVIYVRDLRDQNDDILLSEPRRRPPLLAFQVLCYKNESYSTYEVKRNITNLPTSIPL